MTGRRRTIGIVLIAALALPSAARADRISRLIQILRTDRSYKVRLQVAIELSKLRDKRAVPALIGALRDKNHTVRGVAAAALGRIGDPRAVLPLRRRLKRERNAFAKAQLKKALAALKPKAAKFYISVKTGNKSGRGGRQVKEMLKTALLQEFGKVPGVTTVWYGRRSRPRKRDLRKRKMKGFTLDGSVVSLTHRRQGNDMIVSCGIKVSLSTYPRGSMRAFYSGGASIAVSARSFDPARANPLYKEILAGAARAARQTIVQSFLSRQ